MKNDFELLTRKEAMWAQMLMQVLEDNGITAVSKPVCGAGFSIKTGTPDFFDILVPKDSLSLAQELLEQLFSGEYSAF
ncbi:MAG: hypothetical protein J6Q16_02445 [Clostridia bacterium]|nr:hypothetical protein [Clostridia bacterium]